MTETQLLSMQAEEIGDRHPHILDFFEGYGINLSGEKRTLAEILEDLDEYFFQDIGVSRERIFENFSGYLQKMAEIKDDSAGRAVREVTIIGGRDKSGHRENCTLTLKPGEITGIVGPTGSGKSRLLADIEWMAQNDTPTGRRILINGKETDTALRFSVEHKLVAQLSQNMNFVMDASVREFVTLHAESRLVEDPDVVIRIIEKANRLAGECFSPDTPITALSGGQSRALMIADTAFLSSSPIVLIDEIENAGIDRKEALELLVSSEKIVLIATHDPILALMCDRRIVIRNGGIHAIIETSAEERECLGQLEKIDAFLLGLRNDIRRGKRIDTADFIGF